MILPKIHFERWKFNKEYQIYVSNMGHFKSKEKKDIKVLISPNGYCRVNTSKGIKSAHRLVLLTWRPINNSDKMTVDHLDHNKRNNALYNLEWVSAKENQERAVKDIVYSIAEKFIIRIQKKIYTNKEDAIQALWDANRDRSYIACERIISDLVSGKNSAGKKKVGSIGVVSIERID